MTSPQTLVGRALGEFVVREELGEGGFGKVYLAYQPSLDREVVVKVLHDRHGTELGAQRFLREARLASRLEHRNAAHIYAFGREAEGILWIAMERVRGTPFNRYLAQCGPMPATRFLPILEQLCEVIGAAHASGIVHRDIKPSNVMIEARGGQLIAKLLDFGIAKPLSPHSDPDLARHVARPLSSTAGANPATDDTAAASAAGETADIGSLATMRATLTDPSADTEDGSLERSRALATQLTSGGIVGSPPYMAPEQWSPGVEVDGRADIYALGVVAYEALAGARPYVRRGFAGYEYAHLKQPVPDLPDFVPSAVGEVVKRALAKDRVARFQTAEELARAFRATVHGGVDPDELPSLDTDLADRFTSEAPQPIAECVSALVAARNAHQSRDAVRDCVGVLARYLGLVALACYGRVRPPVQPRLGPQLRALRQAQLSGQQWLELAARASAPFRDTADVHPVVELVQFFTWEGFSRLRAMLERFADSDTLGTDGAAAPRGSEAEVVGWLEARLPELEEVLRAVSFVCDYLLVVPNDDGAIADVWMGIHRRSRRKLRLTRPGSPLTPMLATEHGEPLLSLSPLVRIEPPSPGGADEVFLLSGPASRGAKLSSAVGGLAVESTEPWEWLREHFLTTEEPTDRRTADERAPYRGLAVFTEEDAALFFGRDRLAQSFLNRLHEQSLLALAGPSGAGKSSFVRAGVVPRLPDEWRALVIRPGGDPIAALIARLEAEGWVPAGDLDPRIEPEVIAAAIGAHARDAGRTLLLIVDQGEELFTLCSDPAERRAYAAALASAASRGAADDSIRVIVTVRDDFLVRLQQLSPLRDALVHGVQLLAVPDRDDLMEILVEPARRAGYDFDDPTLVTEMVDAVAGEPGALALLEFSAAKLWEQRDQQFRRLTRVAYEAMGGVAGALARHADDVVDAMPAPRRNLVRRLFGCLVTAEGTRAVIPRAELRERLGDAAEADAIIDRLLAARLLASAESADDADHVEIIHETLLTSWPRLVEWRREDAEGARLRDQLRTAVRQWEARDRPRGLLWRDDALTEYNLWRKRYPWVLTAAEREFTAASNADAERGRRLRRIAVGVVLLGLLGFSIALGLASWREGRARDEAEQQRHVAESRAAETQRVLATQYLSEGRRRLLRRSPATALVYLDAAARLGADSPELSFLLAEAARPLRAQVSAHRGHGAKIHELAVAASGDVFATAGEDGAVVLWDARSGEPTATLAGHEGAVSSVRFDAAGTRVVSAGLDGTARVWKTGGELVRVLRLGGPGIDAAFVAPDRVVTLSDDGAAAWSVTNGERIAALADLGPPSVLAPSPDGRFVAIGTMTGEVHVWSYGARPRRTVGQGTAAVVAARVSADGAAIATGAWDGTVRVFDATTGAARHVFHGHTERITSMEFDASGRLLVTASRDRSATLWDLDIGAPRHSLTHDGFVADALFSPDGSVVLTSGGDGIARLWDGETGAVIASFDGHAAPVWRAAFSTDGERVITASWDGFARMFRVRAARRSVSFRGHRGKVHDVAPFGDDGRVASAGDDGVARIWDGNTGAELGAVDAGAPLNEIDVRGDKAIVSGHALGHAVIIELDSGVLLHRLARSDDEIGVAAFVDESRVVTGSTSGAVTLWDATTGRSIAERSLGDHISRLAVDESRQRVAVATSDGRLIVLRLPDLDLVRETKAHSNEIWTVAYSPTWTRIVTASLDGTAALWDADSLALTARLPHDGVVIRARFDRAGRRLATASEDTTTGVWDARDGRRLGTLRGSGNHVFDVDFDPSGELIATCGDGGSVMIWSAGSFDNLASLEGHVDPVVSVRFQADGNKLVTGGWDGTAIVWTTDPTPPSGAQLDELLRCAAPWTVDADGRLRVATLADDGCLEGEE